MNLPPLIINLAPTGAIATADKNPHLPLTEEAIVTEVLTNACKGISMVHLHVRDASGKPSSDPEQFKRVIEGIRSKPEGRELIVCASTSGRHGQTLEQRSAVLDLTGAAKPDMASLTLGSLNFANDVSINSPDTIRYLAAKMRDRNIKPELEVFDLGMLNFAKALIAEGLIKPPYYFNLLLGNISGAQFNFSDVSALVQQLPPNTIWGLAGIGKFQKPAMGLGCVMAPAVRIGLEDNLWQDTHPRTSASNTGLVSWLTELARAYGRPLTTPSEARLQLGVRDKHC